MRKAILSLAMLFLFYSVYSQNLIGYSAKEIKKYMQGSMKEMNSETVRNSAFRYLKYTDNADSRTLLFFLDRDSVCTSVRCICDRTLKDKSVQEFNAAFSRKGENKWIETRNGKKYVIEVFDDSYSSVITIKSED